MFGYENLMYIYLDVIGAGSGVPPLPRSVFARETLRTIRRASEICIGAPPRRRPVRELWRGRIEVGAHCPVAVSCIPTSTPRRFLHSGNPAPAAGPRLERFPP